MTARITSLISSRKSSLAPHLRRDLPYEPHITLARHADYARLQQALAEAEEAFGAELAGVMREVTLLAVGRTGKISMLETFALNSA